MRSEGTLRDLARDAGILTRWEEADGSTRHAEEETLRRLLGEMGIPAGDAGQVAASREMLEARGRRLAPAAWALRMGKGPREVPVHPSGNAARVEWSLVTEQGEQREGDCGAAGPLRLPADLGTGYHRLEVRSGGEEASVRLILAPPACWRPEWVEQGGRMLGVTAPMYALRGLHDDGIGDFGSLRTLVRSLADLGGDAVALSPIHALFPAQPHRDSPYAPSSRRWLDARYIDLRAAASELGLPHPEPAGPPPGDRVDPVQVVHRKERALRAMFDGLRQIGWEGVPTLLDDFTAFLREGGEDLLAFARFHTRHRRSGGIPWWEWPDGGSKEAGGGEEEEEIRFRTFLQWIAARQLRGVAREAEAGLVLGLQGDLAVGTPRDAYDVWARRDLYALQAEIGAPPDPFSPRGQNWELTPWLPHRLEEVAFEPWGNLLRCAMRGMASLRIDHVMAMERLYWIPRGLSSERGAYVRYPSRALFAVLALESHRSRCIVVGEDLGTLPAGFRDRLREEGILSERLVYFEREPDGRFTAPADYPREAAVSVGSHDLPTLRGWLEGRDILLREELGRLSPNEGEGAARRRRGKERDYLLEFLMREGLLPQGYPWTGEGALPEVVRAVFASLDRAPSAMRILSLEDLLLMPDQLNFPGTSGEYPNWRIRIPRTVESLSTDPFFISGLAAAARAKVRRQNR